MTTLYYQANEITLAAQYQQLFDSHNTHPTLKILQVNTAFNNKFFKQLPSDTPTLLLDKQGLWIVHRQQKNTIKIQSNWLAQQRRVVNAGKKSELLLKAAKIQAGMHIIDATAGLGHDSILLAGRGARVTMLERQPMMHLLLCDALRQIAQQPNWQKLHSCLSLEKIDAVAYLSKLQQPVDLVYLDPMFPSDSYTSAQVNKNMQILHQLTTPPDLAVQQQLLDTALNVSKRVIVKRPRHADTLAQRAADHQWQGDSIRFDGYYGAHHRI